MGSKLHLYYLNQAPEPLQFVNTFLDQRAEKMKKVNMLNISINNLSQLELLKELEYGIVFTPNVDHIMKLQKEQEFFKAYSIADYIVCDSQVLIYASRFLGTQLKEKI